MMSTQKNKKAFWGVASSPWFVILSLNLPWSQECMSVQAYNFFQVGKVK